MTPTNTAGADNTVKSAKNEPEDFPQIPDDTLDLVHVDDLAKLKSIRKSLLVKIERTKELIIGDQPSAEDATTAISFCRKKKKVLNDMRLAITRPITDQKERVDNLFKMVTGPMNDLDKMLSPKLARYQDQVRREREAAAEEQRRREMADLEKKKAETLEQAVLNESEHALDDAIAIDEEIKEVEKAEYHPSVTKINTGTLHGTASSTKNIAVNVTAWEKVEQKYLKRELRKSVVNEDFKSGKREFPGLEVYEESTIGVR